MARISEEAMIKSSRKKTSYLERRRSVAADYLSGMSQQELAAKCQVSQPTISRDLEAIRQEWKHSALIDFAQAKAREVAKIDNLEAEYWRAWRCSIGEKTKTRTRKIPGNGVIAVSVEKDQRLGNAVFLQGVQWCISERCQIFGVYEATKVALVDWRKAVEEQGLDASEVFEQMVNAYIKATDPDGDGCTD